MKRQLMILGVLALIFCTCQQPSKVFVATSGPEIDNLNRFLKAWAEGDWTAYRAAYADTATIMLNTQQLDPDSLVRWQQARRANYENVSYSTAATEYIKYQNGEEWTHWWGKLIITFKGSGRVVEIPAHYANRVMGDKLVQQFGYYDLLNINNAIREAQLPPPLPAK